MELYFGHSNKTLQQKIMKKVQTNEEGSKQDKRFAITICFLPLYFSFLKVLSANRPLLNERCERHSFHKEQYTKYSPSTSGNSPYSSGVLTAK